MRAGRESSYLSGMELDIYDAWFAPIVAAMPSLVPDGFVYMRADPSTCHSRLMGRARPEEKGVGVDYLQCIHEKHEDWFTEREGDAEAAAAAAAAQEEASSSSSSSTSSLGAAPPWPAASVPLGRLQGHVRYLKKNDLSSLRAIDAVPTLVLDCNGVDLVRDPKAKAEMASLVSDFYDYVRANAALVGKGGAAQGGGSLAHATA